MPVQRIVLLLDIDGANCEMSCSRVENPNDVKDIKVEYSGVTRDFDNIILTIKEAILISQGRDAEAEALKG